jgi:hypothetical protein
MSKPEVHTVWVQIKPPGRGLPQGQAAYGYYIVVDNVVTMTDQAGKAAEDAEGRTYSEKLEPSGNHQAVAGRLTRRLRAVLRGESPDAPERVSRPLNYRKTGWC